MSDVRNEKLDYSIRLVSMSVFVLTHMECINQYFESMYLYADGCCLCIVPCISVFLRTIFLNFGTIMEHYSAFSDLSGSS